MRVYGGYHESGDIMHTGRYAYLNSEAMSASRGETKRQCGGEHRVQSAPKRMGGHAWVEASERRSTTCDIAHIYPRRQDNSFSHQESAMRGVEGVWSVGEEEHMQQTERRKEIRARGM
ncbi:hypothetical protein EXIGLDRAFT_744727 [Exidia glandulosa HHB12029]|uniref:Uncharacterized protein n=1 Tax=Exidia glandulosa HHB12029 TaxID=1314781 RepID=A0A165PKJ8_EXIGL|nr:hypothetical protein EXIGLDRAFT_744727 [Exidia glandulosa HHB12029]